MNSIMYLVIDEHGDGVRHITVQTHPRDDIDNVIRDTVGGWFECYPLPGSGATLWCDEDGRMHGHKENKIASAMLGRNVVGTVVITGPPRDGEVTSVQPHTIADALERMWLLAGLEI